MGPYYCYCHSTEHALIYCDKKKTRVSYFNCSELGHMAKDCSPRNGPSSGGISNKRHRKTLLPSDLPNANENYPVSAPTASLIFLRLPFSLNLVAHFSVLLLLGQFPYMLKPPQALSLVFALKNKCPSVRDRKHCTTHSICQNLLSLSPRRASAHFAQAMFA